MNAYGRHLRAGGGVWRPTTACGRKFIPHNYVTAHTAEVSCGTCRSSKLFKNKAAA